MKRISKLAGVVAAVCLLLSACTSNVDNVAGTEIGTTVEKIATEISETETTIQETTLAETTLLETPEIDISDHIGA